ncbi:MAG: AAA family ATPase, partial [Desulfovibrionaceae bacterium]|nr:AAA family ATPase [Desulfovibrionaceae bacterium]
MPRIIATGEQNFLTLREDNLFYIDKSKFIKEWWTNRDRVTLITRPRRFGKTLMLDTVKTFFSREFAGRSDLFAGLEIWKDEEFRNLQGTIPVIYLSFSEIKYSDYTQIVSKIKEIISDLYEYFEPRLNISNFSERSKKQFADVSDDMPDIKAHSALRNLAKYLTWQYQKKPIILLDEYDTPLQEAWLNNSWNEIVGFLRGFFNATFKTNPWLERGLITGITRVSKESIFSDMNNLEVVSVTSDLYADCFGFTEQEVFTAMDEYGLTNKEEVKQWYDGFIFGKEREIYNPWSIIGFLKKRKIAPYWANTSSNSLVSELIAKADVKVKDEFTQLLKGESIVTKLDEEIVFSQLYTTDGAIWSLLMASGYVKPLEFDIINQDYKIIFTNNEVKIIMEKLVSDWFYNGNIYR